MQPFDVNAFVAAGDPNGQQETRQVGTPVATSSQMAASQATPHGIGGFLGNIGGDIKNLVGGLAKLPGQLGGALVSDFTNPNTPLIGKFTNPFAPTSSKFVTDVQNIGKATAQNYSDIAHHPLTQFLQHPVNTALSLLPVADIAAAGRAGLVGEAASTATEATTAADAAKAAETAGGTTTAAETAKGAPNFWTRVRNSAVGIEPTDFKNATTDVGKSQTLQDFRGEMGFKGTPNEQAYQANQIWSTAAKSLNNLLPQIKETVNGQGLIDNISSTLQDPNNPGARVYSAAVGEDRAAMDAVQTQVRQMIDKAVKANDNGALGDNNQFGGITAQQLNTIRQQIGGDIKSWGNDATAADAMRMHLYHEVGQALGSLNPQIQDLLSTQSKAISYGQALSGAGGGGGRMVRLRAPGSPFSSLPIPSDAVFPAIKDWIGRTGEALTGGTPGAGAAPAEAIAASGGAPVPPGGGAPVPPTGGGGIGGTIGSITGAATSPTAQILAPLAVGASVSNQQQQTQQGIQQAQAQPVDFTQPSPDIAQLLRQSQGDPRANPTGYSVADLQQMIAKDIADTGGKNYTDLNRLLGIAKASNPQLTSGAVTKLTAYNGALTALGQVNDAFQSGDANQIANAVAQETPAIAKAFGLSATNKGDIAQLHAMLPQTGDNALLAQQKLVALKQALDARASSDIQSEQSKNSAMDALLSGVGATAGATP